MKSRISSIFNLNCPKCQEGSLFETSTFSLKKPFTMPERCKNCQQPFMPEPGFYYGAMFISYIFMGWFSFFFAAFFHWVLDWSITATFAALIGVCFLFFIYIFRLARSIWIHIAIPSSNNN
ncbi:MAG: DUF983 domain-containing protein [Saprospiraceae bacterium]|jgi:uncharacterized protein (DUF983 family)